MRSELDISVITPCYNGARYVAATLESALNQTNPPLEVIVVDDGSTDNSAEIAASFGPPVRVIRQQNQGESVARNRGVAEAKGDYLLFLDADDLLHPEALHGLAVAAREDHTAVAIMGYEIFRDGSNENLGTIWPPADGFFPAIIFGNVALLACHLIPADLVRHVGGFNESLRYFEDWDFWCRMALSGVQLITVDFVGAYYRRHSHAQSRTASDVDRKLGHVAVLERLLAGMLEVNQQLLQDHGEQAFWSGWAALKSARDLGIPWTQLNELESRLNELASVGPQRLRASRFGWAARLFGIRLALGLQMLTSQDKKSHCQG